MNNDRDKSNACIICSKAIFGFYIVSVQFVHSLLPNYAKPRATTKDRTITLESLLNEMMDRDAIASWHTTRNLLVFNRAVMIATESRPTNQVGLPTRITQTIFVLKKTDNVKNML